MRLTDLVTGFFQTDEEPYRVDHGRPFTLSLRGLPACHHQDRRAGP